MENLEPEKIPVIKVTKCHACEMRRECLNFGWFYPEDKEPLKMYMCSYCYRNFLSLEENEE